jgi:hypothetical protein
MESIPEHLPVSPTTTSVIDIDGVGSTFDTYPGIIELAGKELTLHQIAVTVDVCSQ